MSEWSPDHKMIRLKYSSTDNEKEICDEENFADSNNCDPNVENVLKITIPKQSGKYVRNVSRSGCGRVPELHFSDEVFSVSSVVDANVGMTAVIPMYNASEEDVAVEVPRLQLEGWKPEWDEENENNVDVKTFHFWGATS